MDERTLNELLECSVCLDRLDTSSKVLPCQHTFCRRCLEEIVSTKHELRCPECRFLVEIKVEDLPSNILLIRLLEGMKTYGGAAGISSTSPTSPRHKSIQGTSRSIGTKLSSSQPCAKALYNYEAKEPGDLSFKKGDVVLLRKQVDENWFHGELNGQNGFFPSTYVQVVTPLPPQEVPKCTALYDFIIDDENEKDCLTFHKDEVITVIRRIDEHWAEGKLAERIGIFPISFVDLNDAAKWLINNQPYPQSSLQAGVGNSSSTGSSQVNSPVSSQALSITSSLAVAIPSTNSSVVGCNLINQQLIPQQIVQRGDSIAVIGQQQIIGNNSNSSSSANNPVTTVGILVTTASSVGVSNIAMMSSPTLTVNQATLLAVQRPTSANNSSANGTFSSSELQLHHHHNKRHSFTSIGQPMLSLPVSNQRHSLELPSNQSAVTTTAVTTVADVDAVTTTMQAGDGAHVCSVAAQNAVAGASGDRPARAASSGIFIALYNYKPQKDDEVELSKNAYYIVSEKCQDGWYKGTCLRTGVVGVFPGNYVQMVRLPASMKNAPPKRSAVRSPASITTQVTLATSSNAVVTSAASGSGSSMLPIDNRLIRSSVNRTHSFPKTSPHLNADVHSRSNSQGMVKAPSRTITNVTQALSRSLASATTKSSAALSLLSSSQAQSSSSTVASSSSRTGNGSQLGNITLTTQSHTGGIVSGTDGLLSVMSADRSHVCANPGASNHSPKTSRRHHYHHYHHHKHSSSRGHSSSRSGHSSPSTLEPGNTSSRASPSARASPAATGSCTTTDVSASATVEGSSGAKSASQHSKCSNGSKGTGPASVTADGGASGGSDGKRSKDKKDRKEHHIKRNESLLKRLASAGIPLKGRKSKSPPPPQVSDRREHKHSTHHRSGSEGSILDGATATAMVPTTSAPNTSHRQKSSDKPGKVKPLARDRYRCIVPYPAQSEIELELRVGDIVYVHKKREDGWLKGTLQRTGKTGLFPCSFVEK